MAGPHPAVAATRLAVRRALRAPIGPGDTVLVACSGGADSLALAAALAFEAPKLGLTAEAVVVDHGLQDGSDAVAARAAEQCHALGLAARVIPVHVPAGADGPEAAAREVRYTALADAAGEAAAAGVLLGHTRDDQAETVLLGLARGSGPRAISGMPQVAHSRGVRWMRPLLDVARAETAAACAALGIEPWQDPHNSDPRYLRVRTRQALVDLERQIGPGVVAGLARSAALVRRDLDTLDEQADAIAARLGETPWPVDELSTLSPALRTRVWRSLLTTGGCPSAALGKVHLDGVDALVGQWRGQGPIHVPGALQVRRADGLIHLEPRAC
ncbi:tRNA lysidine(34) synthetase TilS [Flexivirga sp. ID2601S]|uniref:tRNA(Ile)-lysidine synthase n=1 Tax=Flexivirga aerilata TaxID=1656889 RepID=A0A849AHT4_9MICO|nr:tRNA lysidine(34) synthetase TilS [Flexivirga aerilata]NNG37990.1 tRNA lysidine(34) synthetase TilS [Flexivirga aerilata]